MFILGWQLQLKYSDFRGLAVENSDDVDETDTFVQ